MNKRKFLFALDIILFLLIIVTISSIFKKPEVKPVVHNSSNFNAQNYITERMQECAESTESGKCLKNLSGDFLEKFGLTKILKVLGENETKPEFFKNCHLLAHYLGREEYGRKGSVQEVFEQSSRVCLGGTFHGAVEGYLIEKKIPFEEDNDKIVGLEFPKICGRESDYEKPQYFTECHHGLGHAAMFFTENDLLRALKLCDALPTENQLGLCYSGVFMANADGTNSIDHPSKYGIKPEDPFYPCSILEERYHSQCYTYGVLVPYQGDLQKSIEICKGVPSSYRSACFKTIGRDRTMQSSNPFELKNQCESIRDNIFQKDCIEGVAYNLVIRFGPDSPLPSQFCELISSENKPSCETQVQIALKRFINK